MDIDNKWMLWQGKNCQFRLLTWNSFIGQFVHSVGGREWGKGGECIVFTSRYMFHFIRVHGNLVQHPRNNKSIIVGMLRKELRSPQWRPWQSLQHNIISRMIVSLLSREISSFNKHSLCSSKFSFSLLRLGLAIRIRNPPNFWPILESRIRIWIADMVS